MTIPAKSLLTAVAIVVLPLGGFAATPSFNCKSAVTWVEKAICGDDELATLDARLAVEYQYSLQSPLRNEGVPVPRPRENTLVVDQLRWLAARDSACHVEGSAEVSPAALQCLRQFYELRVEALPEEFPAAEGDANNQGRLVTPYRLISLDIQPALRNFTTLQNGEAWLYRPSMKRDGWDLVHMNTSTGLPTTVATLATQPRFLYANRSYVVMDVGTHLIVMHSDGSGQVHIHTAANPWLATIVAGELFVVEQAPHDSSAFPAEILERFDLGTAQLRFSNAEHLKGVPRFWGDRVVTVDAAGGVSVFSKTLERIAYAKVLTSEEVGPAIQMTGAGDLLMLGLHNDRTIVLNLRTMKVLSDLVLPESSGNALYAVSGNLLFCLPAAEDWLQAGPLPKRPMTIYNLATQRLVGEGRLEAEHIDISGNILLTMNHSVVTYYHVDTVALENPTAPEQAIIRAHSRAVHAFEASGSIYDALAQTRDVHIPTTAAIESVDIRLAAADQATWLSASIARQAEGLGRLKELEGLFPKDADIARRYGAALIADFAMNSTTASLESAKRLGVDIPAPLIAAWKRVTSRPLARAIDLGAVVLQLYPRGNRLFVLQGARPTILASFDRASLQHRADYPISAPDVADDELWVSDVTYDGRQIIVWLGSNPEAFAVDSASGSVRRHSLPDSATHVLSTDRGFIVCSESQWNGMNASAHCREFDPRLRRRRDVAVTFPFQLNGETIRDRGAAVWALAGMKTMENRPLLPSEDPACQASLELGFKLTALSAQWLLRPAICDRDPRGGGVQYVRIGETRSRWRQANLPQLQFGTRVQISDSQATAVVLDWTRISQRFIGLDLKGNVRSALLHTETSWMPAWALVDQYLLVAHGHRDLIVYDLAAHELAGIWHSTTPSSPDHTTDIDRIESDGTHVFLLALRRPTRSEVIDLDDLRAFADAGVALRNFAYKRAYN